MNHQSVFVPLAVVLFHFKGHLLLSLSVFSITIYIYAALFNIVPVGPHAFCSNVTLCISLSSLSCRHVFECFFNDDLWLLLSPQEFNSISTNLDFLKAKIQFTVQYCLVLLKHHLYGTRIQ